MHITTNKQPVAASLEAFDRNSGSIVERALFNHRLAVLLFYLFVTLALGSQLGRLQLNASFERMIPTAHTYISNYLSNRSELAGLGNAVRIVVTANEGSIYDSTYLQVLQHISDEVFLIGSRRAMQLVRDTFRDDVDHTASGARAIASGSWAPDHLDTLDFLSRHPVCVATSVTLSVSRIAHGVSRRYRLTVDKDEGVFWAHPTKVDLTVVAAKGQYSEVLIAGGMSDRKGCILTA